MSQLVQAARQYLGVPWRHCGRTATGLDCVGLPWLAYSDCGVVLPDAQPYGRAPKGDTLRDALIAALGTPVWSGLKGQCVRSMLCVGDIVVMSPAARPRHVAIIADDDEFGFGLLHADISPGAERVCQIGLADAHLKEIVSIYRRPVE